MTALALLGTGTGVGKTHVCLVLAAGLRALGRKVWLHKPVACGGWEGGAWPHGTAEDARALAAALGDGQPPDTLCPRQYPLPVAPHRAAAAVGQHPRLEELATDAERVRRVAAAAGAWLLVETAGGLLSPIAAAGATNADLVAACALPALVVATSGLGTINHTALTVAVARQRGLPLLGLVVNHEREDAGDPAADGIAAELAQATGLSVLAELPHGLCPAALGCSLAVAVSTA